MTSDLRRRIETAVATIQKRTTLRPKAGLILGTGLGDVSAAIEQAVTIPYAEIPGFVASTAESHAGELVLGRVKTLPVVAMKGRLHFYEGYSMPEITFPVRVMRALGADTLVISSASG